MTFFYRHRTQRTRVNRFEFSIRNRGNQCLSAVKGLELYGFLQMYGHKPANAARRIEIRPGVPLNQSILMKKIWSALLLAWLAALLLSQTPDGSPRGSAFGAPRATDGSRRW